VNLLLDTHTFVWWDNDELPRGVVGLIQDADEVYVSAVTAWEIAIKTGIGKMRARGKVAVAIAEYGFSPLPISVVHADAVPALPPPPQGPVRPAADRAGRSRGPHVGDARSPVPTLRSESQVGLTGRIFRFGSTGTACRESLGHAPQSFERVGA
jgi:PIN domain nuclease of toxin-antitoxin system